MTETMTLPKWTDKVVRLYPGAIIEQIPGRAQKRRALIPSSEGKEWTSGNLRIRAKKIGEFSPIFITGGGLCLPDREGQGYGWILDP